MTTLADCVANGFTMDRILPSHLIETHGMMPSDRISYRGTFPWLHLFRVFGVALSLRPMLLSGLALLVLMIGRPLGDGIAPLASDKPEVIKKPVVEPAVVEPGGLNLDLRVAPSALIELSELSPSPSLVWLGRPWCDVLTAGRRLLQSSDSWRLRGRAVFDLLFGVAVWSLFGLAICRLAAVRFARDETGSFRQAVQFGVSRWSRAVSSPVIPLAAAAGVMLGLVVIAWFGRLPFVGGVWLVVASPVLLVCGFVVVFLLVTAALGWPLMIAAIATDNCDGFGGLSRSYSLWTGRPAYPVWIAIVAALYGSVVYSLLSLVLSWTLAITLNGATFGAGGDWSTETLSTCCGLLVQALVNSLGISLFWTNATIGYLLLRQSVDQMPLDCIALGDHERPPRDPLPVVGMPATDAVVAEKPPVSG